VTACGGRPGLGLFVLGLAACGATAHPKQVAALPPLLAPLFEADRAWRFDVETTESHDNDGEPMTTERTRVTCTVDEVRRVGSLVASSIGCDGVLGESDPLSALWATDGTGLWRVDDWPTAPLDPASMLLAVPPTRVDQTTPEPDNEDYVDELHVEQDGDAWCITESWIGGDGGYRSLCLGPDGPASGGSGWAGAESHDTTFERAR
jgi:hypothetical protein